MKRRLWEQSDYHCSIIGTCLGFADLRRIIRKLDLPLDPGLPEFVIHATFVNLCKHGGREAKAVEKLLNAKHAGAVRRFAKARDDEALRALWRESRENGDVPGPYWGLLCNPHATEELRNEIFGEVHMLSHLVGATNRADIKRLRQAELDLDELSLRHSAMRSQLGGRIRELERDNEDKKQLIRGMAKELEKYRQSAKLMGTPALREENASLQHAMSLQAQRIEELEALNRSLEQRERTFAQGLERALEQAEARAAEISYLETELARLAALPSCATCATCPTCADGCDMAGTSDCPGPYLCGKRILYVGGRANLVRHYRDLVERHGGEFVHHDGGVEESRKMLPKLVGAVDAVVCPLDCVSHDACLRVKALCGHGLKPLKLLPSSGLSSLARCLSELGAQPSGGSLM